MTALFGRVSAKVNSINGSRQIVVLNLVAMIRLNIIAETKLIFFLEVNRVSFNDGNIDLIAFRFI